MRRLRSILAGMRSDGWALPEAALGQAVQQEEGAERETEQEERDVTVLMERGEESHGLLPEGVRDGGRIYRGRITFRS